MTSLIIKWQDKKQNLTKAHKYPDISESAYVSKSVPIRVDMA